MINTNQGKHGCITWRNNVSEIRDKAQNHVRQPSQPMPSPSESNP